MINGDKIAYKISCTVLIMYVVIALMSSLIAGEDPIICINDNHLFFPAFRSNVDTNTTHSSSCIKPLIPYTPNSIDQEIKSGISPFDQSQSGRLRYRHWLGTDKLGRDVASGMIHGTVIAVKIGFLSVFFSFLIGGLLGLASGYFQDSTLRAGLSQIILTTIFTFIGVYYLWMELMVFSNRILLFSLSFILLLGVIISINIFINKRHFGKRRSIPFDLLIVKLIEIRKSFPGVFLLLALVSVFSVPSVWNIVIIITILGWADFARLARGETIAIKNENYIKNAQILGFGSLKIIFRHLLPNIMPTMIVAVCFSISSAILLESTLSYLGVGLPVEEVSWGKLMAEGRNLRFWWLVVFPGMAIFILVLSLNTVASRWQKSNFTIFTSS